MALVEPENADGQRKTDRELHRITSKLATPDPLAAGTPSTPICDFFPISEINFQIAKHINQGHARETGAGGANGERRTANSEKLNRANEAMETK